MAYLKLNAAVMDHPKIYALSDKAFRLWIWGLCYCQIHLTDGFVPAGPVPPRLKRAADDLIAKELWIAETGGYVVRDYLQWNDSKASVEQKRLDAQSRMRRVRANGLPNDARAVPNEVCSESAGSEKGSGEKHATDLNRRAGKLLQDSYPAWYSKYRHGAKLRLIPSPLLFQDALSLVQTWDDERLEKLAQIVLTTDDEWVSKTDRGFKIFVARASWADDRLRQMEAA